MLRLPEALRSAFKDPLGPVYTDAEELLRDADTPTSTGADSTASADADSTASADADSTASADADSTASADADSTASADADSAASLVAVGDVVTYHLLEADRQPDVAVVDGLTEREQVDEGIERTLDAAGGERITVANPAAELSESLLEAIRDSILAPRPTIVEVDGEEDLAALPAIVAAPLGADVVYGQPGEGMVRVRVTPESRSAAIDLLEQFEGDSDRAIDLLESARAFD